MYELQTSHEHICPTPRLTHIVTLRLNKVGWNNCTSVSVKEGKSSGESRCWDTPECCLSNNSSPALLSLVDGVLEKVVKEQRLELLILFVSLGDITEEDTNNLALSNNYLIVTDLRMMHPPRHMRAIPE